MLETRTSRRGAVVAGLAGVAALGLGAGKVVGLPGRDGDLWVAEPAAARPAYGACPAEGGTSLEAQSSVLAKWGEGACVRQFFPAFSVPAPRDPAASVVHASWKPVAPGLVTPAAVAALTADLLPGDVVEVWHEPDTKMREGELTMREALALKNRFHDVVKQVRPDLRVACTLSGWEADPANPVTRGDIDRWAAVRADLLGLDLDGVRPERLPYPNFHGEMDTARDFVAQRGDYQGWCVPEFGAPRIETDVDGEARAQWLLACGLLLAESDPAYVALFEYPTSPGYELTSPAELSAWRSFV
ncbi:hypothetical protein [Nocardioides marmotae]|uniref:Uncharacterized protein n=1 Tax=Nocardioides marmotae TaxID=2663857 RepID=A0A6I3JEN2_9ACTN|nr:hypothetical protein [Nocardioides marmotae]MCR6032889.1 hypothetical protein [Gordonia jinghuaiqii]MBC9733418.1 hypothetical protein [Nocardioides marmotae]MTB84525.1 hypothetical protein [Nocardioides marmotae]MTB96539.1 hypothetical protein [Nocardioides marmotae]QKE01940.1 hypothetical protein HPC71_13330 [Nocardioides marmotae]